MRWSWGGPEGRGVMRTRGASQAVSCVALLGSALVAGCAQGTTPGAPSTWPSPGAEERAVLERALSDARGGRSQAPWKGVVEVTLRDPRRARVIDGRGGMAVSAGRAVRLILLGPGGMTMFDAWVTPGRWRVAVPAASLVRRGAADDPDDLPVAFLRWWFFTPLAGTVVATRSTSAGAEWLLDEHGAVIDLVSGVCPGGRLLRATRRAPKHEEVVEECRSGAAPAAGDAVHYADLSSGMRVDLVLESIDEAPPDAEALSDPDSDRGGT
jgi:hypothetical protein